MFLAFGVALGVDGLGLKFDDAQLTRNLGTVALAVILVEGGLTTRFSDVRDVLAPAAVLATLGCGVSTGITAVGAHLLLGMNWQLALLLGAIVSSTDAAAVFSVVRVRADAATGARAAGGRVGLQRCPGGDPGLDVQRDAAGA